MRTGIGDLLRHPILGRLGIGHCFNGAECFGRHDDQRRFRVQPGQHIMHMRAVNVGYEMAFGTIAIWPERRIGHDRPKVGPADTNVDNIGDRPALPLVSAVAQGIGKGAHAIKRVQNGRHDINPVFQHRCAGQVAQCGVQHGAAFCFVDRIACEHGITPRGDARVFRKGQQGIQRGIIQRCLGIIEHYPGFIRDEIPRSISIFEQIDDFAIFGCGACAHHFFPHGSLRSS